MVSFSCMQEFEQLWSLLVPNLILQVAEHLMQVLPITPVSAGDENKNGIEQLQQVAVTLALKSDQAVSLWSLLPKREECLQFLLQMHISHFLFLLFILASYSALNFKITNEIK